MLGSEHPGKVFLKEMGIRSEELVPPSPMVLILSL